MSVSLVDPGLPEDDSRQLAYQLLKAMGLSILLVAAAPIEQVLEEAVRRAPILSHSTHAGKGFMRLDADPETLWVAVEGSRGSAVIVYGSPESDSMLIVNEITFPFEKTRPPFAREMVFSGEGEQWVAQLLADLEVVPVFDLAPFRGRGEELPLLPIAVHRSVQHWNRITETLYSTQVLEPTSTTVYVTLEEGVVELWTPIGEGIVPGWVSPLIAAGDHRVVDLDPTIAIATPLRDTSAAQSVDAEAQELVRILWATSQGARAGATAAAPTERDTTDYRIRIGEPRPGMTPSRAWALPTVMPRFTWIERIRESLPDGPGFERLNQVAGWLGQQRGTGFEHAWRGEGDVSLAPSWLTLRTGLVDPQSGLVVGGGRLKHTVWGKGPAHDLGAIDGRNAHTFTEAGHGGGLLWPSNALYVGSMRTGVMVPLDTTMNVQNVDLDTRSGRIGVLHHLGASTFAVTLVEETGARRLLTVVDGLSGAETIRFSPDGAWLLVSSSGDSTLVEVETGRTIALDIANAGWWPGDGSTLIRIHHEDGQAAVRLFSLADNSETHAYPAIRLDVPLMEDYPYVWNAGLSADGSQVLATSPAGASGEYQKLHGVGGHLARFELGSGNGALEHPVFIDEGETLERDVTDARWTVQVAASRPTRIHPDLLARLQEPVTEHEWLHPGRWAREAEQLLVLTLNVAVDRTKAGQGVADLLPEILAYLIPVSADPGIWAEQSDWLVGLRDATVEVIANGDMSPGLAASWRQYGAAIAAIEAGNAELIDIIGAAWVLA